MGAERELRVDGVEAVNLTASHNVAVVNASATKKRAARPKAKRAPARGLTASKLAKARKELRLLLRVAEYFGPDGKTPNATVIERINAALDALR